MDGPGGNLPRRRAGDSNTQQDPSPIKDWQRNTWYGPAPRDGNPFDEPDEAPELLELRSDNVRQKSGEFWQQKKEETGYQPAVRRNGRRRSSSKRKTHKKEARLSRYILRTLGVIVLLGAAVAAVLYFGVYRVRSIRVEGNSKISDSDVITLSGIKAGDSILTLDEKRVAERIQSGARSWGQKQQAYYQLQFKMLEREMPGSVIITVKEREPCCWADLRGVVYVMDRDRVILWETEDKSGAPADLVQVKGLKDKGNTRGGETMEVESAEQQRIFNDLFLELKALQCAYLILEADLSNPGSVTLTTRTDAEGNSFVVNLGDCRNTDSADPVQNQVRIHAKLRSFLLVWEKLHNPTDAEREAIEYRIGHPISSGTIDVRTPESPYYSPDFAR